ncbi:unnamed protein product [Bathycoccus prasinos]
MPVFGFTQYFFGAVVFTLNAWSDEVGLCTVKPSSRSNNFFLSYSSFFMYRFCGVCFLIVFFSSLDDDYANHVLGFMNASNASASLLPSFGCMSYCHLAVSGKDIKMDSILPPVFKPKVVPRSYTKLNSTYRPLLICCHSFSSCVNESFLCLATNGMYAGTTACAMSVANANNSSFGRSFMSSKKTPPTPLRSPLCLIMK